MWETIGKILKETPQRIILPALASIAAAIATILLLPADHWAVLKIGFWACGVFVFCISFLAVELLIYLFKGIKKAINGVAEKKELRQEEKEQVAKKLEKLWRDVDALSPSDRDLLRRFLETKNEPIELLNTYFPFGHSLLTSSWVEATEIAPDAKEAYRISGGVPCAYIPSMKKKYRLNDDIYKALVYSWENYKKISHFE